MGNTRVSEKAAAKKGASPKAASTKGSAAGGDIRVRMYRVGFGDFFLLTVPGTEGPAHILIDCGVHAKPVKGAMDLCIADMKTTTGGRLDLVIVTHAHADHISGFSSNYDDFLEFDVGAVWMSNRLDPSHEGAALAMTHITSVASALALHLGARSDPAAAEASAKVENALGVMGASGQRGNALALELLHSGFEGKAPVYYYQGGDEPELPATLDGMITAELLAPSPLDSDGEYSASDDKGAQYLAAAATSETIPGAEQVLPFDRAWPGKSREYPAWVFDEFDSSRPNPVGDGEAAMRAALENLQPDALMAAADKLDGTLNNQSLVVLFTCQGKKLLFVGDAQWGNWAYWLYGKGVKGNVPEMSRKAADILATIDFYKVGHHGSTNATPIPVVGALNPTCVSMCSTANGAYGSVAKGSEVPRIPLMAALSERTGDRMVRSDWVGGRGADPDPDVRKSMASLPAGFTAEDAFYIDYTM